MGKRPGPYQRAPGLFRLSKVEETGPFRGLKYNLLTYRRDEVIACPDEFRRLSGRVAPILARSRLIEYEIEDRSLCQRRGSASQACLLYAESDDSRRRREEFLQQLKLELHSAAQQKRRAIKRDRRKLSRLLGALDQNLN